MAADDIIALLRQNNLWLATAESCTGGLISKTLTDTPGSSNCFAYGWVTYSNEAKTKLLGVPSDLLIKHGAVSREVAQEMASRAKQISGADLAIAVSGIAGPDGGSKEKPVGRVFIALSWNGGYQCAEFQFAGSREDIRHQTTKEALNLVEHLIKKNNSFLKGVNLNA